MCVHLRAVARVESRGRPFDRGASSSVKRVPPLAARAAREPRESRVAPGAGLTGHLAQPERPLCDFPIDGPPDRAMMPGSGAKWWKVGNQPPGGQGPAGGEPSPG